METRRLITALLVSMAVFYVTLFITNRLFPPPPARPRAETQPATRPVEQAEDPTTATQPLAGRPGPAVPSTASAGVVIEGQDLEPVLLGETAAGNPYPMRVEIQPRGAAVSHVAIRDHYQTVKREQPYDVLSPLVMIDSDGREYTFNSFSTPKVRFQNLGFEVDLSGVVWTVDQRSREEAVFSVQVHPPQQPPVARVVKRYRLAPQPYRHGACTYDLSLSLTVENLSDQPLEVIITQQGPIGFHREDPRWEDRRVIGVTWQNGHFVSRGHSRDELVKKHGLLLGQDNEETRERIAWAAETNRYFACIMGPAGRLGPQDAVRFASLDAMSLMEQIADRADDLTFRFVTVPIQVPPGGTTATVGFDLYIGPKSKSAFDAVETYRQRYYYLVIRDSIPWCTFDGLVRLMMYLLNTFHKIPPHNYGIAIIILVVVVRAVLHPITKKSQVNMYRMQKQQAVLAPKIQAVREKYANDKARQQQAIMEVYREAGINPAATMLTCLPLFLQMPIWVGLWTALSTTVEMRHAPFDGWWIKDLASPDAVLHWMPIHLPLLSSLMGGPLESLNILPILLAISQILQMKYMPHAKASAAASDTTAQQMEQQRRMMMIMSPLFMLLLYNAPAGLNLYIMSSNLFGLLEQWRIRKHLAEEEARQKAEEKFSGPRAAEPRKPGWFARKWEELVKEAEEARRIQSERKKKKNRT